MFDDFQPKPRALWIAALIFLVATVADSWFRWSTFQYQTQDLGLYHHSLWLATHGQWTVPMLGTPLMGYHAEPITFFLIPVFWIWSHPMMFVVMQALLLITMPFTGYRIARKLEFDRRGALWLALTTLLAPATGFIALDEFHPEALAAPLLLLMIEARLASRPGSFWLFFLLAAMCRENVAVLLVWFCVVHWVLEREKGKEWQITFNLFPGVLALAWVGAYVFWLAPKWHGGRTDYGELYAHLGGSGGEMAKNLFTEPLRAGGALWKALRAGNLISGLLAPFLLLPLLRPRWIIIAAPVLIQHLLSSRSSEWFLDGHDSAVLLPLCWVGLAEAAANLYWRDVVARWAAVACAVAQFWMGPARKMASTVTGAGVALDQSVQRKEALSLIGPEVGVMAGFPYLSHLSKRAQLHPLHLTLRGGVQPSREAAAKVDVVLADFGDPFTFNRTAGYYHAALPAVEGGQAVPDSDVLLHQLLLKGTWKVMSKNSISVFLRGEAPGAEPLRGDGKKLDEFHSLAGIQTMPPPKAGTVGLLFTWELKKDRPLLPWAKIVLTDAGGKEWAMQKGPLALGMENGRFREIWLITPDLPPGKYQGQLMIYDNLEAERASATPFQGRRFEVGEIAL